MVDRLSDLSSLLVRAFALAPEEGFEPSQLGFGGPLAQPTLSDKLSCYR